MIIIISHLYLYFPQYGLILHYQESQDWKLIETLDFHYESHNKNLPLSASRFPRRKSYRKYEDSFGQL